MSDMNKADKAKTAESTASKVDALFKPITETNSRRGLKVLVWGEQEVGKTYFGLSFLDLRLKTHGHRSKHLVMY